MLWEEGSECEDRVQDGPASGGKGSKGRNYLDCIRGKDVRERTWAWTTCGQMARASFTCQPCQMVSYFHSTRPLMA